MKKIGIVTHYGENYGGMLQAYALEKYITDLGYSCEIISNDFLYKKTDEEKRSIILKKIIRVLKNPFSFIKRRRVMGEYLNKENLRSGKFAEFAQKNIVVNHTGYENYESYVKNPPEYDVYVCGSDQIWNPNLYFSNGFYFANFAPEDKRVISYASSIGINSLTDSQKAFMTPYLNRLDVVATREAEGAKIVEELTGKPARVVLDPTLLFNEQAWSKVSAEPLITEKYIFCYFFGEREYIEKVKQQIKELTGLKMVCIPYVLREMASDDEKIIEAGPAEFISLIKNASLVLTDSFHATAFSVNLRVPFLTLLRFSQDDKKGMNSRITTLLGEIGLTDRIIAQESDIEMVKDKLYNIDFESAHTALNKKRKEDSEFLQNAIENKI